MTVAADDLRELAARVLVSAGADPDAADVTATSLVAADLRGHGSHGVRLLPGYVRRLEDGRLDGEGSPEVVEDDGATVILGVGAMLGPAAVPRLAQLVADRAGEYGVAAVAVRRCGHLGRLFDLAEAIADRGKIGLVFANDAGRNTVVAPHGGAEPRLATNPLAIGIPRRERPHLVLDMATSATSHGGLVASRAAGRPDEPGWAVGDTLLPASGAKGFGLALVVEALAGVLTLAGDIGDPAEVDYQGILVLALDVERFLPPRRSSTGSSA